MAKSSFAKEIEDRDMRIVQRGEVVVTKRVGDSDVTLGVLGRGSFFGEMSLIHCRAAQPCARAARRVCSSSGRDRCSSRSAATPPSHSKCCSR
jgi:CRP-like cAMP-binding protein